MKWDPDEVRDGMAWLYGGGLVAILLSIFLQYSDHWLSTSDREVRLGRTLFELRSAQHFVGAGEDDGRARPVLSAGTALGRAETHGQTQLSHEEQMLLEHHEGGGNDTTPAGDSDEHGEHSHE